MHEYVTDAIVLDVSPRGERDKEVALYTHALGRVDAFAVGARRPTSKFSPHLDLLNLVRVRLVEKNRITVTDAQTLDRFPVTRGDIVRRAAALEVAHAVQWLAPHFSEEANIWKELLRQFSKNTFHMDPLLKTFGYERTNARCTICDAGHPGLFSVRDHAFFCVRCGSQFPRNELLYLM